MASKDKKLYYCKKCNRTLDGGNFYVSNNLKKYPDEGRLNMCKQCLTMHVDNWDPDTFLWILEEIDVPYVPDEWNKLLAKYGRDATKITGTTILGRYLSKMKLKQFKEFRWNDTEHLQKIADHKVEEVMKRQGYSASEIAEAISRGTQDIVERPPKPELPPPEQGQPQINNGDGALVPGNYMPLENDEYEEDLTGDLTEEDKKYLSLKWGAGYRPGEWVRLEQLYEEMMNSYDIQTAGHIDNLKILCKASLKANQLIDINDVDGAQKMVKMYDSLMRSGNFTAAQNKADSGEYIDSVSELVAICETDGFIPRYYVDKPQDKVDRTLQDLQNYTKTLVTEEMGLGNLIENALKQIEEDKIKEKEGTAEAASDEELLEMELFSDDSAKKMINDSDFVEFTEFEDKLEQENDKLFKELEEGGK